jgi:hypothetical protein
VTDDSDLDQSSPTKFDLADVTHDSRQLLCRHYCDLRRTEVFICGNGEFISSFHQLFCLDFHLRICYDSLSCSRRFYSQRSKEKNFFNFKLILFLKASKTSKLLFKIANIDHSGGLTDEILLFSQQITHQTPKFSCGLFTFDFDLAFKVCEN